MKKQIRLLALLMVMLMIFTACANAASQTTAESTAAPTEATSNVKDAEPEENSSDDPSSAETESVSGGEDSSAEDEAVTTEYEETFPDLPANYYNTSMGMTIEEMREKLVLTDFDFTLAEWMLKRFENAALGLEEPEYPTETETETETETDTDTETGTETGYVEPAVAYAENAPEEEESATIDAEYVDALCVEFEDKYFEIKTQISILTIIYYYDMSDEVVSERYLSSYGRYGDLYNAYVEACKNVYTNSPISDILFAEWTEEDIEELFGYDPETQKLREEVEALQVELNAISSNDKTYNDRAAEIYAQIVTKNNQLAAILGYDNYYEYASKEIYGRDYGVEELEAFSNYIAEYFMKSVPDLYDKYSDAYQQLNSTASNELRKFMNNAFDKQTYNYLDIYIKSYKTGSTRAGFHDLFEKGNFLISKKVKSHPSAFQTYISGDGWDTPFCFFGSKGQSSMTVVHEMGHYYAALHNENVSSYDLAETQSQANEMLFLAYIKDFMTKSVYNTFEAYTMYNYVAMTVVCVIIDEFERTVYALDSVEGFGSKEFDAIMAQVCEKYGGASLVTGNITDINSYWRAVAPQNPVYYISYATSMIAALNIYSVACEDQQAARDIYHDLCEKVSEDDTLLTAAAKAGLSNIFEEQTIKDIVDAALGK